MIFSELYGAYYNCISDIIKIAIDHPVSKDEIDSIIKKRAFLDSFKIESLLPAWGFKKNKSGDYEINIKNKPTMPYTILERRWLKSVFLDRRMILFMEKTEIEHYLNDVLGDVEPLYEHSNIVVFDRYNDGDDFEDPEYIKTFRLLSQAIKNKDVIRITYKNRNGQNIHFTVMPDSIEYSDKDDKFRLIAHNYRGQQQICQLRRILKVNTIDNKTVYKPLKVVNNNTRFVLRIVNERNSLERVMLHFSHFEKKATKISDDEYELEVFYDVEDEKEMVIRILSFGPCVKVIAPQTIVDSVKEKLTKQIKLL